MKKLQEIIAVLRKHKWLVAGLVLGLALVLFAGEGLIFDFLDRKFDRQMAEQKEEIAKSEEVASTHRGRVAELDAARPEMEEKAAATSKRIKESKRREKVIKNEIAQIVEELDRALALSGIADRVERRRRICSGFAAEGIDAGDYCKAVRWPGARL